MFAIDSQIESEDQTNFRLALQSESFQVCLVHTIFGMLQEPDLHAQSEWPRFLVQRKTPFIASEADNPFERSIFNLRHCFGVPHLGRDFSVKFQDCLFASEPDIRVRLRTSKSPLSWPRIALKNLSLSDKYCSNADVNFIHDNIVLGFITAPIC